MGTPPRVHDLGGVPVSSADTRMAIYKVRVSRLPRRRLWAQEETKAKVSLPGHGRGEDAALQRGTLKSPLPVQKLLKAPYREDKMAVDKVK